MLEEIKEILNEAEIDYIEKEAEDTTILTTENPSKNLVITIPEEDDVGMVFLEIRFAFQNAEQFEESLPQFKEVLENEFAIVVE